MNSSIKYILVSISVYLLISGCQKSKLSSFPEAFNSNLIGHWENFNIHLDELTRIIILRPKTGQISVQLWDICGNEFCIRDQQVINEAAIKQGKIQLEWSTSDFQMYQTLSLTETGKLEVITQRDYANNELDFEKIDYFSKEKTKTLFQQIQIEEVLAARLSKRRINGSPSGLNQLPPGTILLYQTTAHHYGKMQIRGNGTILTFRWQTWAENGDILAGEDYTATNSNKYYEMNQGMEVRTTQDCSFDFLIEEPTPEERWLSPQCGASFVIYHLGN